MKGLTDEDMAYATTEVVNFIKGAYDHYRKMRDLGTSPKEPAITLGLVAGYLGQHSVAMRCAPYLPGNRHYTRWCYQLAGTILRGQVRSKRLMSSWGTGLRGKEVRCYEPGPMAYEAT